MRRMILFVVMCLLVFAWMGQIEGLQPKVICPKCAEEGTQSKVYPGMLTMTAMHCGNGYYDEQGVYHPPNPCNTLTRHYSCSNGHTFTRQVVQ